VLNFRYETEFLKTMKLTKIRRDKSNEIFRTETELKIRNELERKMQDIQPNVEK
jgi:hypothetical protein